MDAHLLEITMFDLEDLDTLEEVEPIKTQDDKELEWLKLRAGKFTASEFHRLMAYVDKKPNELPNGALTYIREKTAESLTEFQESDKFINAAMQWGIDHEHEAVDCFEATTGLTVSSSKHGQVFLQLNDDVGGTPDGIIDSEQSGIEIKCPNSAKHLEYCTIQNGADLKAIAPDYYWQCVGLMLITGSESWYFVSYDPRFKEEKLRCHIVKIERNSHDVIMLELRLNMAVQYKNQLLFLVTGEEKCSVN